MRFQTNKKLFFFAILIQGIGFGIYANAQTPPDGDNEVVIKIPEYKMRESMCGPICLAYAAKWCGVDTSIKKAAEFANWQFSTTSLLDLKEGANKIGINCRPIKFDPSKTIKFLAQNPTSIIIGAFKEDHFQVLIGANETKARLIDPMVGQVEIVANFSPEIAFARNAPVLVISPGRRSQFVKYFSITIIGIVVIGGIITTCRLVKRSNNNSHPTII